MTNHTILGASGVIGSRLKEFLVNRGEIVYAPGRNEDIDYSVSLGHTYYCIGVTADFRSRPFDTVDAHVNVLQEFLKKARFESFLYLSSTRVYQGATDTHETADLRVNSLRQDDLYNISKLMGESLCMACDNAQIRVARLSNVITPYDAHFPVNFFDLVLKKILADGRIDLQSDLRSSKDYVDIDDVVPLLVEINSRGKKRVYNIARGRNTTHDELISLLRRNFEFEFEVKIDPNSPTIQFKKIAVQQIVSEFGFAPKPLRDTVKKRIASYQNQEVL